MFKDIQFFLVLILSLIFINCNDFEKRDYIEITPLVINLRDINTEYDDFNSAGPSSFIYSDEFIYSTNVGSAGGNFDIWSASINLSTFDPSPIDKNSYDIDCKKIAPYLPNICNSEYNEFGPNIIQHTSDYEYYFGFMDDVYSDYATYMFASDRPTDSTTNKLNIYFLADSNSVKQLPVNSKFNDAYPCFSPKSKELIFCSDRNGQYDLYKYDIPANKTLATLLNDSTPLLAKTFTDLNSSYDDKCPYFLNDILLFISNRHGDHSNFDIYYSKFSNMIWTDPIRLPEVMEDEEIEIVTDNTDNRLLNSIYDEYRPILVKGWANNADDPYLIIFSSNRPGGQGGFDLHLAILPDNIFD